MASRNCGLKNFCKVAVLVVVGAGLGFGQAVRVPTVTRTVQQFGTLERDLAEAKDANRRASFLRDDFEERLCAQPGTPIPRQDWLERAPAAFELSQEAVHLFGEVANYSALFRHGEVTDTIVDTWIRQDGEWRLAVRYRCPASGSKPAESAIQKRY